MAKPRPEDFGAVPSPEDFGAVPSPQDAPTSKPPGFAEGLGDVARGVASVGGALLDLPQNAINVAKMAYGAGATALGHPDAAPDVQPAPWGHRIQQGLTDIGVPDYTPANFYQDLIQRATRYTAAGMAGGMAGGGAAKLSTVAAPSVSAAGGATANAIFPGNTTANVLGELIPGMVTGTIPATQAKARVTKPLGQTAEGNRQAIIESGGTPSVAQVTEHWAPNFVEGALGQAPGGDIVRWMNNKKTQEGMRDRTAAIASEVGPATSPMQAGRSIKTGTDKFVDKFDSRWANLNGELAKHFAAGEGVPITNTIAKLDEMLGRGEGAAGSINAMGGSERAALVKLREQLIEDSKNIATPAVPPGPVSAVPGVPRTPGKPAVMRPGINPGEIQFQGLRDLRSLAGTKGRSANLKDDISKGAYQAIYGALTDDLRAAAAAKGPAALKAFDNQAKFYKAGVSRIDKVLDPIATRDKVEDIYQAALAGSDKGGTSLWALRRSLPSKEWDDVVSTVVTRMGKANPGQQSAEGDVWSAKKFLTDWNNLSPSAQSALFGGQSTPKLRDNMNKLARASEKVSKAGEKYGNTSRTTTLAMNAGVPISVATAVGTGHLGTAAGIVGGVALNAAGQKLMTHPRFVEWAAGATKIDAAQLPAYMARLSAIAERSTDEQFKSEAQAYIEEVNKALAPQPNMPPEITGIRG